MASPRSNIFCANLLSASTFLMKSLARGQTPEFALPLVHRMRHEVKDLTITTFTELQTQQRGSFNAKGVRRLLDEHFQGSRGQSVRIWRLLMLGLWYRNFLEARPFKSDRS